MYVCMYVCVYALCMYALCIYLLCMYACMYVQPLVLNLFVRPTRTTEDHIDGCTHLSMLLCLYACIRVYMNLWQTTILTRGWDLGVRLSYKGEIED